MPATEPALEPTTATPSQRLAVRPSQRINRAPSGRSGRHAAQRRRDPDEARSEGTPAGDGQPEDGVLLRRPGIVITDRVARLNGRTYALADIAAVRTGPAAHPKDQRLSTVMLASGIAGGAILFGDFAYATTVSMQTGDWRWIALGLMVLGLGLLIPALFALRDLRRLPEWSTLHLDIAGAEVTALRAESALVAAVASTIRSWADRRAAD
jgi:hypothetical protein